MPEELGTEVQLQCSSSIHATLVDSCPEKEKATPTNLQFSGEKTNRYRELETSTLWFIPPHKIIELKGLLKERASEIILKKFKHQLFYIIIKFYFGQSFFSSFSLSI